MTLISSWGGPDSNSYIDVSQANSFIKTALFDNSAWDGLTNTQKQAALITASNDIDSRQYVGHRYHFDQHLEFPRQLRSAFPHNRTSAATTTQDVHQKRMQRNVQEACAHQAMFVVRSGGFNVHAERVQAGIRGISESIGPIREFIQYGTRSSVGSQRIDNRAIALLQPWMTGRSIGRK